MYIALCDGKIVFEAKTKEEIFELLKAPCMANVGVKYLIYKKFAKMSGQPQIVYEEVEK